MGEDSEMKLHFASISGKKVEAAFDGGSLSSDGGVLHLRAMDKRLGLIDSLADCISDNRHPSYVEHSLSDLIRQRVFQIALGYEDANDCDDLRTDPALKMACDRLPITGDDLASQPTMSRLENQVRRSELYRLSCVLVDMFLDSYDKAPEAIILDIDDTDDETHGDQELTRFNGHYDEHCFMPLHIYEGRSGKLITTILRPGSRPTGAQIVMIIKRLVPYIRERFPHVLIILRGDSHFSGPEVHDFCETHDLFYMLGQGGNTRLNALGGPLMERAKALSSAKDQPVRLFTSFFYKAKSWKRPRRIIFKAEVTEQGPNPRYVVTNLESSRPSFLYEWVYCGRGRMEGYIKNHKNALSSDRTSCHKFEANQFRLLLHSAAYVLIHSLVAEALPDTRWVSVQFDTIQKRLLKIGARITELTTKIKIQFPSAFPLKQVYEQMAATLVPDTG